MNLQKLLQFLFIGVLQFAILYDLVQGNESNRAKFTKTECIDPDPEYVANNMTCRVKAARRDMYLLNIQIFLIKPLDKIVVRLKLFKKANTFKPFLYEAEENFCDFLSKKYVSPYMKIIGALYLPYSNVNSSCPVVGQQIFKDMPLNPGYLPSIWPAGEYRLDAVFFRLTRQLLTIQFSFIVQENVLRIGK